MAACQSFFKLLSIRVGIARDRAGTRDKSFARPGGWSERIDAGAEIQNLPGVDTGAFRPVRDIAAMGSID